MGLVIGVFPRSRLAQQSDPTEDLDDRPELHHLRGHDRSSKEARAFIDNMTGDDSRNFFRQGLDLLSTQVDLERAEALHVIADDVFYDWLDRKAKHRRADLG